jgi:hypothetical protein
MFSGRRHVERVRTGAVRFDLLPQCCRDGEDGASRFTERWTVPAGVRARRDPRRLRGELTKCPPRQTTCRSRSRVRRLAFLRGRSRPFSVLARAVPVNLTGAKLKTGDQDGTKSAAPASKFASRTGLRDAAPESAVVHTSPRQLQTLVLSRHEARGTRVCICIETLASPVSSALRPGQGRQRGAPCDRRAAQCGGRKRPRQRRGRERAPRPGPPPTPRRCRLTCLTDVHDCRPSRQQPGSMTTTAGDGGRPRHSTLPAPTRQMQRRGVLRSTVFTLGRLPDIGVGAPGPARGAAGGPVAGGCQQ